MNEDIISEEQILSSVRDTIKNLREKFGEDVEFCIEILKPIPNKGDKVFIEEFWSHYSSTD